MQSFEPTQHRNELIKLIKGLHSDDIVWILHVINKDRIMFNSRINSLSDYDDELININIDKLNSSKTLNELKNELIIEISEVGEICAVELINMIKQYKNSITIRGRDFNQYKSDKRLLIFALDSIKTREIKTHRLIKSITNPYFQFLYAIYLFEEYYRDNYELDCIEKDYAQLITEKPTHFKNYNDVEFYKWAKKYMDEDKKNFREYNKSSIIICEDSNYSVVVNSAFDRMFYGNEHVYTALKNKLSNAWYQKKYRSKNKGKAHHYYLTDKTLDCLNVLCQKYQKPEDKMIEHLINKCFADECTDHNGEAIY